MTDEERKLFERSVIALEKMANEVRRLRGDVERLNARLEPFEGEPNYEHDPYPWKAPKTFRDVLDMFEKVRSELYHSESTISRVGARVDQIRDDAWSRDELKPWIKGAKD